MTIEEKSKEYAKGKAFDAITSAIEQAYADGYEAGFNAGASANNTDNKGVVLIDGVEYVDLGLPSNTLWAKEYLKDSNNKRLSLSYYEAAKVGTIPSEEQFTDLEICCKKELMTNKDGEVRAIRYRSKSNNAFIDFPYSYYGVIGKSSALFDSFAFWLNSSGYISSGSGKCASIKGIESLKAEIKLPVILVKKVE